MPDKTKIADRLRELADKLDDGETDEPWRQTLEGVFGSHKDRVFAFRGSIPAVEIGHGYTSTSEMNAVRDAGFVVDRVRGGPSDSATDTDNPVITFREA